MRDTDSPLPGDGIAQAKEDLISAVDPARGYSGQAVLIAINTLIAAVRASVVSPQAHDCEAWAMEGIGCAHCNPVSPQSWQSQIEAQAQEIERLQKNLKELILAAEAYRANEQMRLRELSNVLSGGSAGTWEEVMHAAESHETAPEAAEARRAPQAGAMAEAKAVVLYRIKRSSFIPQDLDDFAAAVRAEQAQEIERLKVNQGILRAKIDELEYQAKALLVRAEAAEARLTALPAQIEQVIADADAKFCARLDKDLEPEAHYANKLAKSNYRHNLQSVRDRLLALVREPQG